MTKISFNAILLIMNIREKLIMLRNESNMSQQEFADFLNGSRQTVSRWEAGKSSPSFAQITNICRAFGIGANELLQTPVSNAEESAQQEKPLDKDENVQQAKPVGRKKLLSLCAIGACALAALVGLIITIVYAVKDAAYDTSATVWIVSIPSNTPMIILSVFLALFIAVLAALFIFLLRGRKK